MSDARHTIRIKKLSRKYSRPRRQIQAFGTLVVLVALIATNSSLVIADSNFDSIAPHPSCLDFDPSTSLLNDFLIEPLDLDCSPNSASTNVYDYFGYTTYERPRDGAGEYLGALGYQRFVANDGAALYLLRREYGGNSVSTEIMTGKEIKTANTHLLEQGRLHSTGEDCQGVLDVRTESDGNIHLMVQLSVYEALQALLLPKSGPPSGSRKTHLVEAILNHQQQDDYLDFRRACAVTAEYRLDNTHMQLQLTSLRFDINDELSEDAFNWLKSFLPASENLDAGVILEAELPHIHATLIAPFKKQTYPYQSDAP